MKKKMILLRAGLVASALCCMMLQADPLDNRFFPLFFMPFTRQSADCSWFSFRAFAMTANSARGLDGDTQVGLYEWGGTKKSYDLGKIGKALEKVGQENPLNTAWQQSTEQYVRIKSKLQAQGCAFAAEKRFWNHWSLGAQWYFMHVTSRMRFCLTEDIIKNLRLSPAGEIEAERAIKDANQALGIGSGQWSKTGSGDLDVYVRYGCVYDYTRRMRKIDAGVALGGLFPTGAQAPLNNGAAVPFGGNDHYGLYAKAEVALELKEDLTVGMWAQFIHRFSRCRALRLPIAGEQPHFGALCTIMRVRPGWTFALAPMVSIGDINNGFGVTARYIVIHHEEDGFRFINRDFPAQPQLRELVKYSGWTAEYATLSLLYDLNKTITYHRFRPIIAMDIDIPVHFFGSQLVSKTYRVSLGFEASF